MVRIRRADAGDVDFMIGLGRSSPSSGQWVEKQYRDMLQGQDIRVRRLVLIAEGQENFDPSRDNRVGFLVACQIAPEWELENIVVAAQARRSGVGESLLGALLDAAGQTDSKTVFLEVRESNAAARRLYEKLGFKETGRRKLYYVNPLEDAVLFRLDLR